MDQLHYYFCFLRLRKKGSVLVETIFLRYESIRRRKEKHLETKLQRKHVNFRRKNSCYFKFIIIVVILLDSEPLPGQVSQQMDRRIFLRRRVLNDRCRHQCLACWVLFHLFLFLNQISCFACNLYLQKGQKLNFLIGYHLA